MSKNVLTRRWDMHKYETRGKGRLPNWMTQDKTVVYEHLPSQVILLRPRRTVQISSKKVLSTHDFYIYFLVFNLCFIQLKHCHSDCRGAIGYWMGIWCYTDGLNRRCIRRRRSFLQNGVVIGKFLFWFYALNGINKYSLLEDYLSRIIWMQIMMGGPKRALN